MTSTVNPEDLLAKLPAVKDWIYQTPAHLLEKMGYRARLTRTNEPSVDIIAHKDALGFEPSIIKVQVKSSDGKIGDKDVSALLGKLGKDEYGLMVTLGEYTPQAHTFAGSNSNLRLLPSILDKAFKGEL